MKLFKAKVILVLSVLLIFTVGIFAVEADTTLVILHTNDIHGRVLEGRFDGMGFDRLATLIHEMRVQYDNVLLLDAGDTVHGLPVANIDQGSGIIEIMNAIGYHAMVAGNHDFNYGQERLVELENMANFPILAANVWKEDGSLLLPCHKIFEFSGIKVGVFGLATPETLFKSHPAGTVGLTFEPPAEAAQRMVDMLRDDVDFLIALAHLGTDVDTKFEDSTYAVTEVDGIDLVVDGHSHELFEGGRYINDTLVVQVEDYGKHLGVVRVNFKDRMLVGMFADVITKAEAMEKEPMEPITNLVNAIIADQEDRLHVVIGETLVHLQGEREYVRAQETNWGNLITDAMLFYADADFAITNGGGIRTSVPKGHVTMQHVYTVLPFGNLVTTLEITGEQLLNSLEIAYRSAPEPSGAFMQGSGITLAINTDAEQGNRVHNVKINGEPLQMNKTYIMATNDFLAAGGDGMPWADLRMVWEYPGMESMVADYITENSPIYARTENRIIVAKEYVVREGEWLAKIARDNGVSLGAILAANDLDDPHMLTPGQVVLLPLN